jgi:hypothetical protein
MSKAKTDSVFDLTVNGAELHGWKRRGVWKWKSTVPGIHDGMTTEQAIAAFMPKALAGAVTVRGFVAQLEER